MNEHQKIAEGDIVDHKIFGLGTVKTVDDRGYTNLESKTGIGYPVTVVWDDLSRRENTVMHWALNKVSSPDVRPFIFWDKQWQPLREDWIKARRKVEVLCETFEPAPGGEGLNEAINAERAAWMKMSDFIESRGQ